METATRFHRNEQKNHSYILFALLLLCLFISALGTSHADSAESGANTNANRQLYSLINQRLGLMRDVAAYKWIHALPIEDLAREKVVLDKSLAQARELGLEANQITAFFQQQIYLAKLIQRGFHLQWQQPESQFQPTSQAPDLTDTRKQLISLGNKILKQLAAQTKGHSFNDFSKVLTAPFISPQDKALLFKTVTAVNPQRYPSRLDKVLAEGILTIGTTGDYAPFSFSPSFSKGAADQEANKLVGFSQPAIGIDIDLGKHLAETLQVYPLFLQTSWPTLLKDLNGGDFDILMSGISKKLFRQRHGFFSSSYHEGGKTPIARCSEAKQFDSLKAIDRPNVTVIVNPGGTNQRFVNEHIKQAKVLLHQDNRTIFQRIVAGDADVMITDKIEVELKSREFKNLCGTLDGKTFDYSAKAYLMPRDSVWLAYVNTWLEQVIKTGLLTETIQAHLQGSHSM